MEQLGPYATTTEPAHGHNQGICAPQQTIPHDSTKFPHASTETPCSQINKNFFFKSPIKTAGCSVS